MGLSRLLHYESIQGICSIEDYHRVHSSEDALADLKNVVGNIEEIAKQTYQTDKASYS